MSGGCAAPQGPAWAAQVRKRGSFGVSFLVAIHELARRVDLEFGFVSFFFRSGQLRVVAGPGTHRGEPALGSFGAAAAWTASGSVVSIVLTVRVGD